MSHTVSILPYKSSPIPPLLTKRSSKDGTYQPPPAYEATTYPDPTTEALLRDQLETSTRSRWPRHQESISDEQRILLAVGAIVMGFVLWKCYWEFVEGG